MKTLLKIGAGVLVAAVAWALTHNGAAFVLGMGTPLFLHLLLEPVR